MSKKYQLYGLGSALVDTEIEVKDEDLVELKIDKGLMTLVGEQRQHNLMNYLRGHLTMSRRACGGSAANTVISFTKFGGSAYFCCRVADDDNGRFYLQDLEDNGVAHNGTDNLPSGITGKCLVMITPDAERTMNTYLGISEGLCEDDVDEQAIAESEYLYLEGYLVTSTAARLAAVRAREYAVKHDTKIAISLSDPGIVEHFKDGLQEMIGERADLLFCNRAEALSWTGVNRLDDAISELQKTANEFVITLGNEGSLIFDGFRTHRAESQPVTAVDTNGAGDMYAGAFLYGVTQGYSHALAAEFANLAAGAVVSQYGPRLHPAEYAGLKDVFNGQR